MQKMLKKVYEDPVDSESDNINVPGGNSHNMLEDFDDDDDNDDSMDYEEQLKKDTLNMVAQKLDEFENRLKYLFEEHNYECKDEFKLYEQHIKDNVLKMTAYVQEVHANHIAEINNFKKQKDEQIIVNQMLVKKMQGGDRLRQ